MVRAGKWFRSFLAGRKERSQEDKKDVETSLWLPLPPPPPPPPTSPKECIQKKRNFNREWKKKPIPKDQTLSVYAGRAAGRKTRFIPMEEIAAIKIQSSFRSYLARKALRALKGVVKLQAIARGLLARKQAAASLRSMPDLLTAQTRALAQRAQVMEAVHDLPWRESFLRKMMVEFKSQQLHDVQKNTETEQGQLKASSRNMKINALTTHSETKEHRVSFYQKAPPSPSNLTDTSSGANSARFEEPSFAAAKGGPQFSSAASHKPRRISSSEDLAVQEGNYLAPHESAMCPNYMANTESWRAKARSQTAPRQRPESAEQKQSGRRRAFEGRSLSRVASSREQHSWCGELDRSATVKAGYCRFIVA